jgi:NADH-quinone oxidoreductase subunit H
MKLLLQYLAIPLCLSAVAALVGLLLKGLDRKICAYYQGRIGPPLVQPFRDIRKLMHKRNVVPETAVPWLFNGGPPLALAASLLLAFYVTWPPIARLLDASVYPPNFSDTIIILYVLMIPAVCLVVGGFASGSIYASVGAQREMVILACTELPLAVTVVTLAMRLAEHHPGMPSFSLTTVLHYPVWQDLGMCGLLGVLVLLLPLLLVLPAELSKIPFDQAEAETEIAEGLLAEYSGRKLALLHLAEAIKAAALCALVVVFFFPFRLIDFLGLSEADRGLWLSLGEIVFFLFKMLVVYLVAITTVRSVVARLKIGQAARVFLVPLLLCCLAGHFLIRFDAVLRVAAGG